MNRLKLLFVSISLIAAVAAGARDYTRYVNPFVGTDAHGHTFPAAVQPFGMVQAGPDTRTNGWDGCAGYHYSDSVILGFTHTHLSGVGCEDYCDILFMPVTDAETTSRFSHSNESAAPGFYQVYLEHQKVNVRIAAGRRMAMHEYTFQGGEKRAVRVDLHFRDRLLGCSLEQVGPNAIRGWRQSRSWAKPQDVYFYAEFSAPILGADFADSASVRLRFNDGTAPIKVKVGISSVSTDNARENLYSESSAKDWDLDKLAAKAKAAWNNWLSRIDITGTDEQKCIFYTNLYHCAIHPSLYSDVNGEYRGMDREVQKAEGFDRYTVFSMWDVFRSAFPLYNMVARDYMPDFLKSMMSVYDECGRLPKWELAGNETFTMIGFNAVSVIADAYAKGTLPKDQLRRYYEAMKVTAENTDASHTLFCKYGFDPAGEDSESVSKTLEFAYNDWCVAQIAKVLGEETDYQLYMERSQYWKNIFDSESGFMRPRELGGWAHDFDPTKVSAHFTEANSWQYSFFVPQDIAGHIAAFGGPEAYTAKLDALFNADLNGVENQLVDVSGFVGQYAHGNEPSHHTAYLYDFAGQPWKTQELVRHICDIFYTAEPDGLCGNEDCGQMSAWYVLSTLGIYSLTPGTTTMALASPLYKKAVLNIDGQKFTISADKPELTYIASANMNGNPVRGAAIDFCNMLQGGTLSFRMAPKPTDFGKEPVMVTACDPACLYEPDFPEGFGEVKDEAIEFTMRAYPQTEYNDSYTAGGPDGLVDGRHGKVNWRAGGWQGYRGTDMDVIIDLLGSRTVSAVGAEFIQDMENYIWMPKDMLVYTSTDGENWTLAGTRPSDVAIDDAKVQISTWEVAFAPVEATHVRVVAHLFGEIPSWHRGYGDKGFIFVDEISVK